MDESLSDAVKYISDTLKAEPEIDMLKLIEEVSQKFDLNPMQEEFLTGKYILKR